jgi:AraC-like DNA-binding protein
VELAEVARAVNASVHHFCKAFKKATGLTFTEYLGMVRVARATELLADPHARVSEVAYRVGFSSLTHFNRVFKKLQGQSPTEYRQKRCNNFAHPADS